MRDAGAGTEMAKECLRVEIEYTAWANRLVLDACAALTAEAFERDLGASHRSIGATLRHMYSVEGIWLVRLRFIVVSPVIEIGKQKQVGDAAVPEPGLEELKVKWREVSNGLAKWVETLEEPEQKLNFRMLKGSDLSLPGWKVVLHMANHSTLHRGQVISMLRQLGQKPPQTDLFSFYMGQNQYLPADT